MSTRQSPNWYGKSLVIRIYSFIGSTGSGNIFLSIAGTAIKTRSIEVHNAVRLIVHFNATRKVTVNQISANTA